MMEEIGVEVWRGGPWGGSLGWVIQKGEGYIEKRESTFIKSGPPGGLAGKNSFSQGLEVDTFDPVLYIHPAIE
jgi:hypothetical protein